MSRITPDPTFYATAREAAAAQPEKLGYVVTLNPGAPILDPQENNEPYIIMAKRLAVASA